MKRVPTKVITLRIPEFLYKTIEEQAGQKDNPVAVDIREALLYIYAPQWIDDGFIIRKADTENPQTFIDVLTAWKEQFLSIAEKNKMFIDRSLEAVSRIEKDIQEQKEKLEKLQEQTG